MEQKKTTSQRKQLSNSKPHDSGSKPIFGNAELCSQFLRNYMNIPLFENIRAEDIEDLTERFVPMFTEERNSDTVKRIKMSENSTFYFVSLIEHKTKVDYNVSMQLLRYMVYIWEDYENFVNDVDMSSLYKIALERSKWKAMKEGEVRGREAGFAEGEGRFAELTRLLIDAGRLSDLEKAASDAAYRNKLYQETGL